MSHFRIRYATYNGRFQPCSMVDGVEYAQNELLAFPQNAGSLEKLLNHNTPQQVEDCFFLDIWTPDTSKNRPILFWIHGGAFVAGASADNQNDATNLSKNNDIIVVSVSYRLGFLGTAYFDNIPQQNCGFHDIITALQWTNKYIHEFGGNNKDITIGGQSSGAWYAMAIHTSSRLQHLFSQTMLFSWPGTMKAVSTDVSKEISERFFKSVGKSSNYNSISIEKILASQLQIGKENKKKYQFNVPLLPSIEPEYIAADFFKELPKTNKRLFLQYTKDECGAYIYKYPIYKHFPSSFIVSFFLKRYCSNEPLKTLRKERKNTKDLYLATRNITSYNVFHQPAQEIAKLSPLVSINEFSFKTQSRTGCCHCFDLPFIFDNFIYWQNSPIFENCDKELVHNKINELQQIIKNFIYNT